MAASTYFDQIQQLYIAYFGRPADPVGLTFWANQVDATNGSVAAVIAGFSSSSESNALYAGVSTAQKISSIYLNLFNRLPEAAGLAFWAAQVESGAVTQAQVAYQIQSSPGPSDALAVANKLAMAKAFTAQLDTPAELAGYSSTTAAAYGRSFLSTVDSTQASVSSATTQLGSAVATATGTTITKPETPITPPVVGMTYALTTGIDTLVAGAGNDTFTATLDPADFALGQLNKSDSINGGAGTDTLSLTVTGAAVGSLPAVTISNIEKLLIQDLNKAGSVSNYNLAGITGLTSVVSNVSTSAMLLSNVNMGATVGILGDGSTTVSNLSFSMANASDAVSVLFDGGVKGSPSLINSKGTASIATINSSGVANTMGTISLTSGGDTINSLTLNAATDLTGALTSTDYASSGTLTVTGAGKVNFGSTLGFDGAIIDASANSGGLTIALSNNIKSFSGGSGADRLLGTATVANTSSIDGGTGIDTVSATLINAGNAAVFKNFELLDLAGTANSGSLDVSQLVSSTITGVVISGPSTGNYSLVNLIESTSGFNVNVTGSTPGSFLTLGFASASVSGSSDMLKYTFNNLAGTATDAGSVTSQGIETITISSGGLTTGNALRIVDNAAKSIVITGDKALNLTLAAQSGKGGALTELDGSAATGSLTITTAATTSSGQSALAIKTGSGNDTITVATSAFGGSFGSTVTTGTGTDKVVVTAATVKDTLNLQLTTLADFGVGDSLTFGNTLTFVTTQHVPVSPADLASALTQASQGQAANFARWFTFSGDTYIIDNVDGIDGIDVTDIVVKLSGTVDLSGATFSGGTLTL